MAPLGSDVNKNRDDRPDSRGLPHRRRCQKRPPVNLISTITSRKSPHGPDLLFKQSVQDEMSLLPLRNLFRFRPSVPLSSRVRCSQNCGGQSLQKPVGSIDFHVTAASNLIQSSCEPQISSNPNSRWKLDRDQGVGGSNPLSPTIQFSYLEPIPAYPKSHYVKFVAVDLDCVPELRQSGVPHFQQM
jgi:hypothetical protein